MGVDGEDKEYRKYNLEYGCKIMERVATFRKHRKGVGQIYKF